jgi:hypothetical protein
MKVKPTRSILINGEHAEKGKLVDIDEKTGNELVRFGMVVKASDSDGKQSQPPDQNNKQNVQPGQ